MTKWEHKREKMGVQTTLDSILDTKWCDNLRCEDCHNPLIYGCKPSNCNATTQTIESKILLRSIFYDETRRWECRTIFVAADKKLTPCYLKREGTSLQEPLPQIFDAYF